jgi:hypothetical protein
MISGEDHLARLNAPPLAGDTGPVLKTGSSCFWGFVFSVWPPNQSTQRCATFPLFLIRVNEARASCLPGNLLVFVGFSADTGRHRPTPERRLSSRLSDWRRQSREISALLAEAVQGAWIGRGQDMVAFTPASAMQSRRLIRLPFVLVRSNSVRKC